MIKTLIALALPLWGLGGYAQVAKIVHPAIGTTAYNSDSTFSIKLMGKKQYYAPTETATADNGNGDSRQGHQLTQVGEYAPQRHEILCKLARRSHHHRV